MLEQPEVKRGGLWRDADFLKFWGAESLSMFGTQISMLAIPLLAVTVLDAGPFQMGLINAAQFLPYLLFTLLAGVWVDQRRRRPIMIGANLGRAAVLALIPLTSVLGLLRVELLAAIVFAAATLTVVFDLAYQAYLPSLVKRDQLIEGNGKLEGSRSIAQAGGPGIGGLIVGLATAPVAVLLDALTYLVSAIALLFIRRPEAGPATASTTATTATATATASTTATATATDPGPVLTRIGAGLRLVAHHRHLRAIAGEAATYNLFNQAFWAVLVLHLSRELHFSALLLGTMLAMSGVGAFAGSVLAGRLARRWGLGRTIVATTALACAAPLLIPIAGGNGDGNGSGGRAAAVAVIAVALVLNGAGVAISNIHVVSLRQTVVPPELLGRTNAGYRFLVTGTAALGALLGGWLGGVIGLRATLAAAGLATLTALLFVVRSPLARLRVLADATEAGDPPAHHRLGPRPRPRRG
ncbi:MFS transporter [Streptomyces roseifaciens]|uniref:MFS transporter n=1 Tax=Streptomyces roseifaciens TaxID=1488406 RepID=UPI0007181300|nr:MFS transporter [Streptomyces roseifaciens]